jgi:transposase-like protein
MANRRPKRQFTEAFKAETIRLVRESGKPISAIAREMDLTESAVRQWVKDAEREARRTGTLSSPERKELEQLRRDVRTLRTERDILKKAMAFFAKDQA